MNDKRTHLGLWFREDERTPFWKGREWWLSPTVRGRYLGSLMKGWWQLGRSSITYYFEIEFAIGGEDSMVQAGIVVPYIGRCHVGVRVPRKLTKGWIYHRREWALRFGYVGRWAELMIASDEHMRGAGMVSYYRRLLKEGRYDGPFSRLALWPGIHLTLAPRLRDRLLGRLDCTTTKGEREPVVVPMPEGNYPGWITREVRIWKRKRWPFSEKRRVDFSIDMDVAIPVPGKGENFWDCEDDAIYGTGGRTVHDAVANMTRDALRQRQMYAGEGWVPGAGWPEEIRRVA